MTKRQSRGGQSQGRGVGKDNRQRSGEAGGRGQPECMMKLFKVQWPHE